MNNAEFVTLTYKHLSDGRPLHLSVYPPTTVQQSPIPTIVYFHGGGLCVGNRHSWHPAWLQRRANARGFAFVTPDYRLLPPSTGHSILEDVKDLFTYLANEDIYSAIRSIQRSPETLRFKIDTEAIVVAGSSAGGLCAYLAAIHCESPKPKAVLSMYGMGGDFFTSHYLLPKQQVFFRGRELLDPKDFAEYLHPRCNTLEEVTDSPLAYHSLDYRIPGYPANPRMLVTRLYLQLGIYLDYYTGSHSPSLSEILRGPVLSPRSVENERVLDASRLSELIPKEHHVLFPQLQVTPKWPQTILCHGTADTAVLIEESLNLAQSLREARVDVRVFQFDGEEHSFDYQAGSEEKYGKRFNEIIDILQGWVNR